MSSEFFTIEYNTTDRYLESLAISLKIVQGSLEWDHN